MSYGAADTIFKWSEPVSADSPSFVSAIFSPNASFRYRALFVSGPRLSGVTTTLRDIVESFRTYVAPTPVECVWIDCRSDVLQGNSEEFWRHLRGRIRPLRGFDIHGAIAEMSLDAATFSTRYAIVLDQIEALSRTDIRRVIESVHVIQKESHLIGAQTCDVLLLVGGAITLDIAIVGVDKHVPCITISTARGDHSYFARLHDMALSSAHKQGKRLDPGLQEWIRDTAFPDLSGAQYLYSSVARLLTQDDARLAVVTVSNVIDRIRSDEPFSNAFVTSLAAKRAILEAVWAGGDVASLKSGSVSDLTRVPPATRDALYSCGLIYSENGHVRWRSKIVLSAIRNALARAWDDIDRARATAIFLSENVGVTIRDLDEEGTSSAVLRDLKTLINAELRGELVFLHYGTVESVDEGVVRVSARANHGGVGVLEIERRRMPYAAYGDVLLYYAKQSCEEGLEIKMVTLVEDGFLVQYRYEVVGSFDGQ